MTSTEEPEEGVTPPEGTEQGGGQENEQSAENGKPTSTPGSSEAQVPVPLPPVQVPDRYEIHRCKLNFSITMLEDDGHADGRQTLIGVRNDEDVPLTALVRAADLPGLLPQLVALQADLVADLPRRKEAMREKLEEARRKQQATKTAPKRDAKAHQTDAPAAAGQPITQEQATVVKPTPPAQEKMLPSASSPSATRRTSAKHKGTPQEDDSPVEQMTLFG